MGIEGLWDEVQVGEKATVPACFLKVSFLRVAKFRHQPFSSISGRLIEGRRSRSDFYRLERPVKTGVFVGLLDRSRD